MFYAQAQNKVIASPDKHFLVQLNKEEWYVAVGKLKIPKGLLYSYVKII